MLEDESRSAKKEIVGLLAMISSAGGAAVVIALLMVYFYGPSGLYSAKKALLAPSQLLALRYRDVDRETGAKGYYLFDRIEFTYYDPLSKSWSSLEVAIDKYKKFYELLSGDQSVRDLSPTLQEQFSHGFPSQLKIIVQSEERRATASKTFQEVTLSFEGDYYRIELHEDKRREGWAYFFHKDIYRIALDILK